MQDFTLLLSVRPLFADKILSGSKTIELRRVRPNVDAGDRILLYSSSPEMALLGSAKVEEVISGTPRSIWLQARGLAGISRQEYDNYFAGTDVAIGIRIYAARRFERPIPLQELRRRWPWLRPPQSFRYLSARFDPSGEFVRSLSPFV